MAKKAVVTKKTTSTKPPSSSRAVAPRQAAALPANLDEAMDADAGKGISTAQEDNLVPLIYVIQPLSPQADKRDQAKYIEGAEPGSIWLKNAPEPIVPGDEGIIFQPCFFQKNWVEWIPRDNGGGLVGITETCPAEAKPVKENNVTRFVMPNGNEVKETRYHYGFVHLGDERLPYCIPLTSTGHTVSRDLMSRMRSKVTASGARAPSWAFLYKLTSVPKQNKKGRWFQFALEDVGFVESMEDYNIGKALYQSLEKGEKKAAVDEDTARTDDSGDGDM